MVETVKVEVVEIPVGKLLEIASVEIVLRRHEQFLGCATVVVHRLALGVYHPAILVLVVIYPHAYLVVDVTEDLEIRRVFARIRYAFALELMHHSGIFKNRLLRIYLHAHLRRVETHAENDIFVFLILSAEVAPYVAAERIDA